MGGVVEKFAFAPPNPTYENDKSLIWLKNASGESFPAALVRKSGEEWTILFSHGNAEDLGNVRLHLKDLTRILHVNAFSYEYPGYGLAEGKPTEKNCFENAIASYQYLVTELNIPPSKIILFGRSLGSGPTCELAYTFSREKGVAATILQCPIASAIRVALPDVPFSFWFDKFCNIDKMSKICGPVFIMHGYMDEIVPVSNGKKLKEKCPNARYWWIKDARHNDIEVAHKYDFYLRLREFLEEVKEMSVEEEKSKSSSPSLKRREEALWVPEESFERIPGTPAPARPSSAASQMSFQKEEFAERLRIRMETLVNRDEAETLHEVPPLQVRRGKYVQELNMTENGLARQLSYDNEEESSSSYSNSSNAVERFEGSSQNTPEAGVSELQSDVDVEEYEEEKNTPENSS